MFSRSFIYISSNIWGFLLEREITCSLKKTKEKLTELYFIAGASGTILQVIIQVGNLGHNGTGGICVTLTS